MLMFVILKLVHTLTNTRYIVREKYLSAQNVERLPKYYMILCSLYDYGIETVITQQDVELMMDHAMEFLATALRISRT